MFKNEREFSKHVIEVFKKDFDTKCYSIESQETQSGFPDLTCLTAEGVFFIELKILKSKKYLFFEPTQPVFYRENKRLASITDVCFGDVESQKSYVVTVDEVMQCPMEKSGKHIRINVESLVKGNAW